MMDSSLVTILGARGVSVPADLVQGLEAGLLSENEFLDHLSERGLIGVDWVRRNENILPMSWAATYLAVVDAMEGRNSDERRHLLEQADGLVASELH